MDEMRITSGFARRIIGKLIQRTIRQKLGYDLDIRLNGLYVSLDDDKANMHLNVNASLSKNDLARILKDAGLN